MLSRVVVPGMPHHVTQRGVRSMDVFDDETDRALYLTLLREHAERCGVTFLAWCLMSNHVHLIAVPKRAESLARGIGEAHRLYARAKNFRAGVRGWLFQGRFGSYVMDKRHLVAAARYVELNPVAAGVVDAPGDYEWSSARYHTGRTRTDPIVTDRTLAGTVRDAREWRELLSDGVEEVVAKRLERSLSTGRPVGSREFVQGLERRLGRDLAPRTGGWPKGKKRKRRRN